MVDVCSFPPISSEDARIAILGTMPGVASLQADQYYAHPRNAFWPIMGVLIGAVPSLPYPERIAIVSGARIALWEVLQSCYRPGSLDSAIEKEVPNDFNSFLETHSQITHLFFNGAKAEHSFKKLILPVLKKNVILTRLPSTSPAHAGMNLADKTKSWRIILEPLSLA